MKGAAKAGFDYSKMDALAARSAERLHLTIQLADTGIHPGSGVGNHRRGLTGRPQESGDCRQIPTVIGAAAIVVIR